MWLYSIVLLVILFIVFFAVLALWTYKDASVRTDKPGIWTLIVLVTPNFFGLIIYLLVGRVKEGPQKNRYKMAVIGLGIALFLIVASVLGIVILEDGKNLPTIPGVSIGSTKILWNDTWIVSFKTSGDDFSKTIKLNEEELQALEVSGTCEEGTLYLEISQGETVTKTDISNSQELNLKLTDFHPGLVNLKLTNEKAKNAKVEIRWQTKE